MIIKDFRHFSFSLQLKTPPQFFASENYPQNINLNFDDND